MKEEIKKAEVNNELIVYPEMVKSLNIDLNSYLILVLIWRYQSKSADFILPKGEIANLLFTSPSSVFDKLKMLEEKKLIKRKMKEGKHVIKLMPRIVDMFRDWDNFRIAQSEKDAYSNDVYSN